jgi:hypothetical protein
MDAILSAYDRQAIYLFTLSDWRIESQPKKAA